MNYRTELAQTWNEFFRYFLVVMLAVTAIFVIPLLAIGYSSGNWQIDFTIFIPLLSWLLAWLVSPWNSVY